MFHPPEFSHNTVKGRTVSNRELGRAPVNEATKILVIVAPRGRIMLSLTGKYSSPTPDLPRSNISDKKVNMEFDASLKN